ncbi:glycosyltransferase [Desulfovibrio sp. JC010]|uniref:glycosyltransferase n=1 Tax=Desulfovibrio sp. JC010 TaxID=2593641 RepID=UPI0013D34955|nr:glycosyltransferase [Desulfovibrio sp. JC010]NDV28793.1 glycosyltransferase [Desulfovibrio sp. JC010]
MNNVSIVIITLNEESRIGNILSDLKKQTRKGFEVIVVDSKSSDATVSTAKEFEPDFNEFKIIEMEQQGVSLGRNTGAEHAKYERLLFLDADVRLSPTFLEEAADYFAETKIKVCTGAMTASPDENRLVKIGVNVFYWGMKLTQLVFPTAVGACIFSTKTVHQEIGGFDESISLCEDCDYARRASQVYQFRVAPLKFEFDARRLNQDGIFKTGLTYLKANIYRLFKGEIRNNEIPYSFGHYR